MSQWLEVEEELIEQRAPMLGKFNVLTQEQLDAIDDVNERYATAARNAIAAMTGFLLARASHH